MKNATKKQPNKIQKYGIINAIIDCNREVKGFSWSDFYRNDVEFFAASLDVALLFCEELQIIDHEKMWKFVEENGIDIEIEDIVAIAPNYTESLHIYTYIDCWQPI